VGWYAFHLLEDFANREGVLVNLYTHTLIPEDKAPGFIVKFEHLKNLHFRYYPIPSNIFLSSKFWFLFGACFLTPLFIALDQNDIFFSPNFVTPRLFRVTGRKVITVHDCTFAFFPELVRKETLNHLRRYLPNEIKTAGKIIAVSNQTKRDIEKIFTVAPEKVKVVYNGNSLKESAPRAISNKPYLLFVGTLEPRKNILSILDAFERVRNKGIFFHLYLIGKVGWSSSKILEKIASHPFSADISRLSYVDSESIVSFYREAFCLLFPSLYEGFGLPVVEAMSMGCPVIATALASIPEVGGDACLYVKQDPESIAEGIVKLYEDEELRRALGAKGLQQARKFSWKTCADETLEVLKEAARS
jgi:glycosyltransferase involved in cell wall biosynthesis